MKKAAEPPPPREEPARPEPAKASPGDALEAGVGVPGERDTALEDRVKAVHRKRFLKRGRLQLTALLNLTWNDAFYQKLGLGGRLAYNLQDSFAVAVSGSYYLVSRTDYVKQGVREANGTPMEFNTIAISHGITMGTEGMKTSLVSREVIADSIELMGRGHMFDALVVLVGCDKTIPGGAMALPRCTSEVGVLRNLEGEQLLGLLLQFEGFEFRGDRESGEAVTLDSPMLQSHCQPLMEELVHELGVREGLPLLRVHTGSVDAGRTTITARLRAVRAGRYPPPGMSVVGRDVVILERGRRDPACAAYPSAQGPRRERRIPASVGAGVSLLDLAAAVRTRRVSSEELVRVSLERIERLNPALNAVIALRAEEAIADARVIDEEVTAGEDPGPLAGLPLLVKDNEDAAGMGRRSGRCCVRMRRRPPPTARRWRACVPPAPWWSARLEPTSREREALCPLSRALPRPEPGQVPSLSL